jgi:hypothetical protein
MRLFFKYSNSRLRHELQRFTGCSPRWLRSEKRFRALSPPQIRRARLLVVSFSCSLQPEACSLVFFGLTRLSVCIGVNRWLTLSAVREGCGGRFSLQPGRVPTRRESSGWFSWCPWCRSVVNGPVSFGLRTSTFGLVCYLRHPRMINGFFFSFGLQPSVFSLL